MELKGVHLVRKGGHWEVEEVKFKELMWETCDRHKVFGLYYEKTIIFNGKAGMGKTEWAHTVSREFALRVEKLAYGWGTICKYGIVTKAGQMGFIGCFVMDDFGLKTRGGARHLSIEEVKHLLHVSNSGVVAAHYGDAVFPAHIHRVWCINYENTANRGSWFERQNAEGSMDGLIDLLSGDSSRFYGPGAKEDVIAVARRAIIFNVDEQLFAEAAAEGTSKGTELARAEQAGSAPPRTICEQRGKEGKNSTTL